MDWIPLQTEEQLTELNERSKQRPQLLFKHSTRCPVSAMVKNRLYKTELPDTIDFYYLDLIAYRAISNKIAANYGVRHESPQVLLIKDGNCIYHESHSGVFMEDVIAHA